ncbi:UDP-N-acetyl glucosamine 2-epimerase [Bacteroides oleiciplenus]|uniref:UDP-N-acetylglucosamine 2-epimerase n=1 Tax=Bacteroides oleiciplenus YIT 12058 TaxID=742727 RepID=K9EM39_9BACE|nr:UDP-N-acetyl glucosamine 2-epimerase [Bacteroides oleiciplenus]EKU91967.1 UDP-N-acetylglucosamine 2-epimerase [Bacteroides oleiciplenus YIT 12058]
MKITIVAGARPNFMKIAPITRAIKAAQEAGKRISYRLVYTGRQDDTSLDASLFSDLDMKQPDGYLGVIGHDHSEVAAAIMLAFEKELNNYPAQVVLVVDDLTATMSCSIVAKKRGLKVAHLIAGTRSFDMNMPREVNRTIVDAISDYLFTAGMVANRNLNQEGMIPEYIHYVGNILIDTVRYNRHRLLQPVWFSSMGLEKRSYLLLTLNRHDLLTKKKVLNALMQTLVEKAEGMPIIAPLHPYVQNAIKALEISAPNLHILPPQSYLHFGYLINHAKGIITDSGNIAEEATFLDVPCITLNSYAEHPETWRVGTNELVNEDPAAFASMLETMLHGEWKHTTLPDRWDGRTAERIVQTLIYEESKSAPKSQEMDNLQK